MRYQQINQIDDLDKIALATQKIVLLVDCLAVALVQLPDLFALMKSSPAQWVTFFGPDANLFEDEWDYWVEDAALENEDWLNVVTVAFSTDAAVVETVEDIAHFFIHCTGVKQDEDGLYLAILDLNLPQSLAIHLHIHDLVGQVLACG